MTERQPPYRVTADVEIRDLEQGGWSPLVIGGTYVITPGYSTEDDIPKMVAVRRTGRPEDAVFLRAVNIQRLQPTE